MDNFVMKLVKLWKESSLKCFTGGLHVTPL